MNGATVCCRFETCKKKFHVVCGLLVKCVPDMASASMICSEHLGKHFYWCFIILRRNPHWKNITKVILRCDLLCVVFCFKFYTPLVGQNTSGTEAACSKCNEDKCHNSMLHCMTCGSHTHQQCLSPDVCVVIIIINAFNYFSPCRGGKDTPKLTFNSLIQYM